MIYDLVHMTERRNWSREETLLAFRLYCYTPFGRLHAGNPDIIQLAQRLGRTPGAVGMKACNFASLDPLHQSRGVVGLSNRSKVEEQIWEEFQSDSETIAEQAEQAFETFVAPGDQADEPIELNLPGGVSEVERTVRARRVQQFFRHAVLTSYNHRCALTGLAVPALLNASHIIPWAAPASGRSPDCPNSHRADPSNGLCLNVLHDRAFDRGLITFDENLRLVISPQLITAAEQPCLGTLADQFNQTGGRALRLPERFAPNEVAMAYHREHVFQAI